MACAAWALGESGVRLVDATAAWDDIVATGEDLVLHDSLCPMAPPAFIHACLGRARATGHAVIGVRPVTDTVKVVADQRVGTTLDRDALLAVTSPLVIPAAVLAQLPVRPHVDLARAVADLAAAGQPVETLAAPPEGRRVSSAADVRVLDALPTAAG